MHFGLRSQLGRTNSQHTPRNGISCLSIKQLLLRFVADYAFLVYIACRICLRLAGTIVALWTIQVLFKIYFFYFFHDIPQKTTYFVYFSQIETNMTVYRYGILHQPYYNASYFFSFLKISMQFFNASKNHIRISLFQKCVCVCVCLTSPYKA